MVRIKKLNISNVFEDGEQPELSQNSGGSVKLYYHFGKLAVSYKVRHVLTHDTIPPRHLCRKKDLCLKSKNKNPSLYKIDHYNFVHNSQNFETTEMFTNRKLVKQIMVYLYSKVLLSNWKTDTFNNREQLQTVWTKEFRHKRAILFHLHEFQKQKKLNYDNRNQNTGYLWRWWVKSWLEVKTKELFKVMKSSITWEVCGLHGFVQTSKFIDLYT